MEQIHAQRDHMTRDFHNKIDAHRQRDSGLKGIMPSGEVKDFQLPTPATPSTLTFKGSDGSVLPLKEPDVEFGETDIELVG